MTNLNILTIVLVEYILIIFVQSKVQCTSGICNFDCGQENCDTVVCTNNATSCIINCGKTDCDNSKMYLAAKEYNNITCNGDDSCKSIDIFCGIPSNVPGGGWTQSQFIGHINSCNIQLYDKSIADKGDIRCFHDIDICQIDVKSGYDNFKKSEFLCELSPENAQCILKCDSNDACIDSTFDCFAPNCDCQGSCNGIEYTPNTAPPSTYILGINTINPTRIPTHTPTNYPSINPSLNPSETPSLYPSKAPSLNPSETPSVNPSEILSLNPSRSSSEAPSVNPLETSSINPSEAPSLNPSISSSLSPSTSAPSDNPSISVTIIATPTISSSSNPSISPTIIPSISPTTNPSNSPTFNPSINPSISTTAVPTIRPSIARTSYNPTNPPSTPSNKPISTVKPTANNTISVPATASNTDSLLDELLSSNPLYFVIAILLLGCCCASCTLFCWMYFNHMQTKQILEMQQKRLRLASLSQSHLSQMSQLSGVQTTEIKYHPSTVSSIADETSPVYTTKLRAASPIQESMDLNQDDDDDAMSSSSSSIPALNMRKNTKNRANYGEEVDEEKKSMDSSQEIIKYVTQIHGATNSVKTQPIELQYSSSPSNINQHHIYHNYIHSAPPSPWNLMQKQQSPSNEIQLTRFNQSPIASASGVDYKQNMNAMQLQRSFPSYISMNNPNNNGLPPAFYLNAINQTKEQSEITLPTIPNNNSNRNSIAIPPPPPALPTESKEMDDISPKRDSISHKKMQHLSPISSERESRIHSPSIDSAEKTDLSSITDINTAESEGDSTEDESESGDEDDDGSTTTDSSSSDSSSSGSSSSGEYESDTKEMTYNTESVADITRIQTTEVNEEEKEENESVISKLSHIGSMQDKISEIHHGTDIDYDYDDDDDDDDDDNQTEKTVTISIISGANNSDTPIPEEINEDVIRMNTMGTMVIKREDDEDNEEMTHLTIDDTMNKSNMSKSAVSTTMMSSTITTTNTSSSYSESNQDEQEQTEQEEDDEIIDNNYDEMMNLYI